MNPDEKTTGQSEISIVILNWNDKEHLQECLESLAAGIRRSHEIIVVDNASTDGSASMVEAKFPHVKLIRCPVNIGFPKGNNLGMEAASGRYIYLLNSDIKVLGNCVDDLAAFMDANPRAGMCGPRIFYGDMRHQSSCRRRPTLWNNFCMMSGLARLFRSSSFFSGEQMFYFKGEKTIEVDVLVGCFWVVRREALAEFGPLDPGFFTYAEDVDWCLRCGKAGWKVMYFHGASAIHYQGASSKKDPVRCAVTQQQSILRFWRKHHGWLPCLIIRGMMMAQWAGRYARAGGQSILKPSSRAACNVRMEVSSACVAALWAGSATPAPAASTGTPTAESTVAP